MKKVAVIGGGLAGLATASALKKDGYDVTVFESDPELKGRGLGILMQPLGMSVLKKFGLADEVLANGVRINGMHTIKVGNNKVRDLSDIRYKDMEPEAFGVGIYRPKLYEILLKNALELGVKINKGVSVEDAPLQEDGQRHIIGGADHKDLGGFDLVVDSSGYKSPVRAKYAQIERNEPYAQWYACFVCDDDLSLTSSFTDATAQRFQAHQSFITIPIGKDPVTGKNRVSFLWDMPANLNSKDFDLNAWKKSVIADIPEMKRYLDQITSPQQVVKAHYSDVALKNFNAEKLVFVGDAAHSNSPFLGQSTSMGFTDAFVLSKVLQREPDLQKALQIYSDERKDHVKTEQGNSRMLVKVFHSASVPVKIFRDWIMPFATKIPFVRKQTVTMTARGEKSLKDSPLRKNYGI